MNWKCAGNVPFLAGAMLACFGTCAPVHAAGAPGVDALKQALQKRLLSLRPDGTSERHVLFQQVTAGQGGNFRVTAAIYDYGPGYPANRYYGETCVRYLRDVTYTMAPDGVGGWRVEGRMTPNLSDSQCKPNPSAGVASIPLASVAGTAAPAAQAAGQADKAPVAAAGGSDNVAAGAYLCWANGQARMLMNFKVTGANQYVGTDGKPGRIGFDSVTQRVSFKGGSLDGVMPDGFHAVFYSPQGRPTVSFRGPSGSEAVFCQKQ